MSNTICTLCKKNVCDKKSIKCSICSCVSHYKCNLLSYIDFQALSKNILNWHCLKCSRDLFPFTDLNNYKFITTN